MAMNDEYLKHAQRAIELFRATTAEKKYEIVNAVEGPKIRRVLDLGCGAGQGLIPFAERTDAFCVGVDIAQEVGEVGRRVFASFGMENRAEFLVARGEELPFASDSFDVVLCLVSLPYMDNRKALREIARVLRPNGKLVLKIHAPRFYLEMIRRRVGSLSLKELAYPIFSLFGGTISTIFGRQPLGNFWKGKEIFQTENFLRSEFAKIGLEIESGMPDSNPLTPSFRVRKVG
jgi:ubiquinone/menaquinone biosynthesis C-methylase UbiE